MKRLIICLVMGGIAVPSAMAQSIGKSLDTVGIGGDEAGKVTVTLEASAAPAFGKPLPFDTAADDLVDEGEYGFTFKAKRGTDALTWKLDAGGTMSPHLFDDRDRESGLFGQISIESTDKFALERSGGRDVAGKDQTFVYARYRLTQPFKGLFDTNTALTHKVTLGMAVTDYLFVQCKDGETPAGGCTGDGSIGYKLSAEVAQTISADDASERLSPRLAAEFILLTDADLKFTFEASASLDRYDNVLDADGAKRIDKTVKLRAALSPAAWLQARGMSTAIDIGIGGEYRRRWSNVADKAFERGFFMPSLTLKAALN
ncbi:hypothetical protein [Sphingomonas sp.]|uniref:hypothetical protein n=1 Tax=Sphingomonas sp. TaxID=28214 RepID=UPI002EDA2DA8